MLVGHDQRRLPAHRHSKAKMGAVKDALAVKKGAGLSGTGSRRLRLGVAANPRGPALAANLRPLSSEIPTPGAARRRERT